MGSTRTAVAEWLGIIAAVLAIAEGIWFVVHLMAPQVGMPSLAGSAKLQAVLVVGIVAATAHGLLWTAIEPLAGWHHHAGGSDTLPEGWSAVVQSMTITVPLAVLPIFYPLVFKTRLVQGGHVFASLCMIVGAMIGHLILYGVKGWRISGIKRAVFPLDAPPVLWRALLMEAIYAVIHFGSIVLVYRFALLLRFGHFNASPFLPALSSGTLWFLSVCVFILLRYPDSLSEKSSIELRGSINGTLLLCALTGGLLM